MNLRGEDGSTALMWAVYIGNDKCVKIFLESGADVNIQNDDGGTPLVCALIEGHVKCIKLLVKAKAKVNMQNIVVWNGFAFDNRGYYPEHYIMESWQKPNRVKNLLLFSAGQDLSKIPKEYIMNFIEMRTICIPEMFLDAELSLKTSAEKP